MADKVAKQKSKAKREQPSVLGTLPATRPERIGRPRGGGRENTPRTGPAAPKAAAPMPTAAKAAAPKLTAATPQTAKAATSRRNGAAAKPASAARYGPTAVRPGAPPLEPRRATDATPPRSVGTPTGTELVTTTIRAAGELAQIGFTVGGQVLKRAVDRLPKP
jgi:hypothetical protein